LSLDNNKSIVRRAIEEPWKGDLNIVDELFAADYVGHDPAMPELLRGPSAVREFISTYREAYPDAKLTVETQVAEADMVATRWTARGTHEGELMGIEPTGKQVTVTGLTLSRVQNGKIVEEFQNWDALGMMKQLDALPELARV
jgi:steroid delta-isomerase-like uncharacterized protein